MPYDRQHVGAGVLIVDVQGNAIVNLKDDSNHYPYPGTLSLFGGAIEPYEREANHLPPHQRAELALRRELTEEILLPGLVDEVLARLICLGKQPLQGRQLRQSYDFWSFLCLVDTHTFQHWYHQLFVDTDNARALPRVGLLRPNEGSQHYVHSSRWPGLFSQEDAFLGGLEVPIKQMLGFIPQLSL